MSVSRWFPLQVLPKRKDIRIAFLLLNTPLTARSEVVFKRLWQNAVYKVFADGAANVVHAKTCNNGTHYIPDLIGGDLDSAHQNVLNFFQEKGSVIQHLPDQDHTDFTKCLEVILQHLQSSATKVDCIMVQGGMSNRIDHFFGNIHTLYTIQPKTPLPIFLMTESSICFLLQQGFHEIDVSSPVRGPYCGLIPVGEPCEAVTTTGLKWNLDNQELRFGGLVSTSNTWTSSPTVTVRTDKPLLFTMEYELAGE